MARLGIPGVQTFIRFFFVYGSAVAEKPVIDKLIDDRADLRMHSVLLAERHKMGDPLAPLKGTLHARRCEYIAPKPTFGDWMLRLYNGWELLEVSNDDNGLFSECG